MDESVKHTMLHGEPERKPVDWHCTEQPKKTLSEMSIEQEEELTADEEKELAAITPMDGPTYSPNETKQQWWDLQLELGGQREKALVDGCELPGGEPGPELGRDAVSVENWWAREEHAAELDID